MESILLVEIIIISCFILVSNRPKTMSYNNYIFQKKLLHMKTKGSVYKTHLFSENSPQKVSMRINICGMLCFYMKKFP